MYASAEKCSVSSVRSLAREDPVTRTVVGRRYTRRPDVYSSFVAVTRGRGAGGTPALPHHAVPEAYLHPRLGSATSSARRSRGSPGPPPAPAARGAGRARHRQRGRGGARAAGAPFRAPVSPGATREWHTSLHYTLHYTLLPLPHFTTHESRHLSLTSEAALKLSIATKSFS